MPVLDSSESRDLDSLDSEIETCLTNDGYQTSQKNSKTSNGKKYQLF